MTAFVLVPAAPARASARKTSARVRQLAPTPSAPMRRKLRRETPSQRRVVRPKRVSMAGPILSGGRPARPRTDRGTAAALRRVMGDEREEPTSAAAARTGAYVPPGAAQPPPDPAAPTVTATPGGTSRRPPPAPPAVPGYQILGVLGR